MYAGPIIALPLYLYYEVNFRSDKSGSKKAKVEEEILHNHFVTGYCMIPHIKKIMKGGEDAFAISKDSTCMVVADGVGGWSKKGVDPALFSKELVAHFQRIYEGKRQLKGTRLVVTDLNEKAKRPSEIDLKHTLVEAVKETKSTGTSTFVAIKINENTSEVSGLNLGDSGYMHVRQDGDD